MNKPAYLAGFIILNLLFVYVVAGTFGVIANIIAWGFALRYTVFRKYFKKQVGLPTITNRPAAPAMKPPKKG